MKLAFKYECLRCSPNFLKQIRHFFAVKRFCCRILFLPSLYYSCHFSKIGFFYQTGVTYHKLTISKFYIFTENYLCNCTHISQFQGLCLMKSSSEMLQNLPYFIYLYMKSKNPKLLFPFFEKRECTFIL